MHPFEWALSAFLIYFGFHAILGPLMVWRLQRLPESYSFRLLDSDTFLVERSAAYRSLHAEIQHKSFEYIGSSELLCGNASMFFGVYHHHGDNLVCSLVTVKSGLVHSTHIEFTKVYADGSVLDVSNAAILSVFPGSAMKLAFRFPWINDFDRLLETSRLLIDRYQNSATEASLAQGDEFAEIEGFMNRELAELIERGWVSPLVHSGEHRLTFKGAVLMTWKLIFPIKQILDFSEQQTSLRAIKNL
jgi:hypothetical protein